MTDPETDGCVIRRRILAFLVDGIVVTGVTSHVLRIFTDVRRGKALAIALGSAFLGIPYHALLEGIFGQTVGKRLLDISVRSESGGPCSVTAASVRTVFRFVDWLPAGYLAGFVSIALSDRHQRLGDRYAETVVVRTDDTGSKAFGSTDRK